MQKFLPQFYLYGLPTTSYKLSLGPVKCQLPPVREGVAVAEGGAGSATCCQLSFLSYNWCMGLGQSQSGHFIIRQHPRFFPSPEGGLRYFQYESRWLFERIWFCDCPKTDISMVIYNRVVSGYGYQ